MSPGCHDPDFDLAEGSSSDGFNSVVSVRIILLKNHKQNTYIYAEHLLESKRTIDITIISVSPGCHDPDLRVSLQDNSKLLTTIVSNGA